jgi:CheY-like chemotaxis protein
MIFCREDLLLEDHPIDEGEEHVPVWKRNMGRNLLCDCGRVLGTWVRGPYQVSYVQIPLSNLLYLRHTTSFGDAWPKAQATISFSGMDTGYRILIADVDQTRRQQRRQFLEAFGYSISEAGRGGASVEAAVEERAQLVLMNNGLADMTGLQATDLIRRQVTHLHIVLLDSASDEGDRRDEALRGGCHDYLQEPCFKLELLEMVKRFTFQDRTSEQTDSVMLDE